MSDQFYYFTDPECTAVGPYDTAEAAKADAQECEPHDATIRLVKVVSVSKPPSLKRTWR